MAKRMIKDERIKKIIKNIADDFKFSGEVDEYAMLFYKADSEGIIRGKEIEQMLEYVTTGLSELQHNIAWREEFLSENQAIGEMNMLKNLKTIEEEYIELSAFLKH